VERGECVALLGPSGSGKTTLLRLIAGLEAPTSGRILIDGKDISAVPPHQRGVSYLPQRVPLYPQLSLQQNLEVVADGRRIASVVEQLQLGDFLLKKPAQLSGGQVQRAGLAKILLQNRPIWLLDEPLTALDPMFRGEFRQDLLLLATRCGATMLIVTHDPIDAVALGQRIGVLVDGSLQQLGTPQELRHHPRHRFVSFCMTQVPASSAEATSGA